MKIVLVAIATLTLSACGTMGEYSCGGKIRCSDPDPIRKVYVSPSEKWEIERKEKLATCEGLSTITKPVPEIVQIKIQESVRDILKDPESARFKDIKEQSSYDMCVDRAWGRSGLKYIGKVNAKNSYGGYTGFKRFASGGTVAIIED